MSAPRLAGIVGATGGVGRSVVQHLLGHPPLALRLGGRDEARGRALAAALGDAVEWRPVDAQDPAALATFCAGCDVIVNAAGPARALGASVGRAAFAAGADYVDTSGYALLELPRCGRRALTSAGMYPGLSGLLPRFVAAQGFDTCTRLTIFIGGCEELSVTAALDYLDALRDGFGAGAAAWLDGRRVSQALPPGEPASLPFFPRPVVAQPYLTAESERLARALGLRELRCYSVFDGSHVLATLPQAMLTRDAPALVRAARLDACGQVSYQILLFELHGTRAGQAVCRSLFVKARSGVALTGAAAAVGVRALGEQELPAHVHEFALALEPCAAVARLRASADILAFEIFDEPLADFDEGTL
jgi:hypothetical protein